MKKKIFLTLALIVIPVLFVGGLVYYENYVRYRDVCVVIDKYVDNLNTPCYSYGYVHVDEFSHPCHGKYTITGVGRIVIVKINDVNASKKDYLTLKNVLAHRYEDSNYVNRVFINSWGNISIDCRR